MSEIFHNKRDLTREFLSYLQVERGLSKNSIAAYRRDMGKLKKFAEGKQLELVQISRTDLREFIASLSKSGLSPNSVNRAISAVRGFYKFLLLDGHIKKHPAEDLDTRRKDFIYQDL